MTECDNTITARGFAREVDGRFYGPEWMRPANTRRVDTFPARRPRRTFYAWDNARPRTDSALRIEDPYGPLVWLGIFVGCVGTLAVLAVALPSLLTLAIAIGDHFGITARPR